MTAKKQANPAPRTLRFDAESGALEIIDGRNDQLYWVEEVFVPANFGPGRGFEVRAARRSDSRGLYHVYLGRDRSTCDCADATYRGRFCRHQAALAKLLELGLIPDPRDRAANTGEDAGATEHDERPEPRAYPCTVCHANPVDPANGEDTCSDCLRRM